MVKILRLLLVASIVAFSGLSGSADESNLNEAARQYLGMLENFAGFAEQRATRTPNSRLLPF